MVWNSYNGSYMDGVGVLNVAEKLSEYGMITCLTKQHDVKKIKQFKRVVIYENKH